MKSPYNEDFANIFVVTWSHSSGNMDQITSEAIQISEFKPLPSEDNFPIASGALFQPDTKAAITDIVPKAQTDESLETKCDPCFRPVTNSIFPSVTTQFHHDGIDVKPVSMLICPKVEDNPLRTDETISNVKPDLDSTNCDNLKDEKQFFSSAMEDDQLQDTVDKLLSDLQEKVLAHVGDIEQGLKCENLEKTDTKEENSNLVTKIEQTDCENIADSEDHSVSSQDEDYDFGSSDESDENCDMDQDMSDDEKSSDCVDTEDKIDSLKMSPSAMDDKNSCSKIIDDPKNKENETNFVSGNAAVNNEENIKSKEKLETKKKLKGKKRKLKEKPEEVSEECKKSKPVNLRKNIREIIEDVNLEVGTREAQKKEFERIKRVQEAQQRAFEEKQKREMIEVRELIEKSKEITDSEEPKSQDKDIICLDSSEEDGNNANFVKPAPSENATPELPKASSDVIDLSSEEDTNDLLNCKGLGLLNDSEAFHKDIETRVEEDNDPENSGCHTNDAFNQPDESGRILVNVGHPEDEEDIFVAPQLCQIMKPHQIGGVRFLYDNIIESVKKFDKDTGFGCILAHSMGLGKTLQIITFSDIFLRHTPGRTIIIVAPINTIQNWVAEFDMWIPANPDTSKPRFRPRNFQIFTLLDSIHKNVAARHGLIKNWNNQGGVLLMGYEMYRLLTINKIKSRRGRKKLEEVVDLEEEDRTKVLSSEIFNYICDPGPDLIVCDEGHRIKNNQAGISQALKNIRTRRRVVLTGYPLQNNLIEYWCMVDFSRPNYLGSKTEFNNMFERPIMNGQCVDSTPNDKKLMKCRAHVLHTLLIGFVQRRSHSVLKYSLPPKKEHVLIVRLSPLQRTLYTAFMEDLKSRKNIANPIKAFSVCIKICNHPDILHRCLEDQRLNDIDVEVDDNATGGTNRRRKCKSVSKQSITSKANQNFHNEVRIPPVIPPEIGVGPFPPKEKEPVTLEWAKYCLRSYVPGRIENGCKLVVLLEIIKKTLACGDRLLLFSQSLYTLNSIEDFLQRSEIPYRPQATDPQERWMKNVSYLISTIFAFFTDILSLIFAGLDGSTSAQDREKLINNFNRNEKVALFMLSTRAGCLGINLIGANRVVIYDASWNPCHDAQAVCRVYRYGQKKPIHVYRLITDNTLEKKIYERQIRKRGMSDRVVDELNPEAKFTSYEVNTLLNTSETEPPPLDLQPFAKEFSDYVLQNICRNFSNYVSQKPFEHESLLLSSSEERLTKNEKKMALQSYEHEKRYANFRSHPTNYNAQNPVLSGNPAKIFNNIRMAQPMNIMNQQSPVQSTPLPMRPYQRNATTIGITPELAKQGVSVQRITIQKDLSITANKPDMPPIVIPTGQQVLVLRTVKGVYLRTPDGKVIAVKLPQNKSVSGTANESAPSTSKEIIDISDDEERSHHNMRFGVDKRMYNVNSVRHTSGGAIIQKKSMNNMPIGSAMWKSPVQFNQRLPASVSLSVKPQPPVHQMINNHSNIPGQGQNPHHGVTIGKNMVAVSKETDVNTIPHMKKSSSVTCTPIAPAACTNINEDSQGLSSKNVVTISKILPRNDANFQTNSPINSVQSNASSGVAPSFTNSKPYMASLPLKNVHHQGMSAISSFQNNLFPVERNGRTSMESSPFNSLNEFVNKANMSNHSANKITQNVDKRNTSIPNSYLDSETRSMSRQFSYMDGGYMSENGQGIPSVDNPMLNSMLNMGHDSNSNINKQNVDVHKINTNPPKQRFDGNINGMIQQSHIGMNKPNIHQPLPTGENLPNDLTQSVSNVKLPAFSVHKQECARNELNPKHMSKISNTFNENSKQRGTSQNNLMQRSDSMNLSYGQIGHNNKNSMNEMPFSNLKSPSTNMEQMIRDAGLNVDSLMPPMKINTSGGVQSIQDSNDDSSDISKLIPTLFTSSPCSSQSLPNISSSSSVPDQLKSPMTTASPQTVSESSSTENSGTTSGFTHSSRPDITQYNNSLDISSVQNSAKSPLNVERSNSVASGHNNTLFDSATLDSNKNNDNMPPAISSSVLTNPKESGNSIHSLNSNMMQSSQSKQLLDMDNTNLGSSIPQFTLQNQNVESKNNMRSLNLTHSPNEMTMASHKHSNYFGEQQKQMLTNFSQTPLQQPFSKSLPTSYDPLANNANMYYNHSSMHSPTYPPISQSNFVSQPMIPPISFPHKPPTDSTQMIDIPSSNMYPYMPQAASSTSHHQNIFPWLPTSSSSKTPQHKQNEDLTFNSPYSYLSGAQSSDNYMELNSSNPYSYYNPGGTTNVNPSSHYPYYPQVTHSQPISEANPNMYHNYVTQQNATNDAGLLASNPPSYNSSTFTQVNNCITPS
ncbi:Helicase ARIP4 [Nymphon striatum]|nr:Helicase ARIP4 [Nymphon striatum]